jgi:hypothetical protein
MTNTCERCTKLKQNKCDANVYDIQFAIDIDPFIEESEAFFVVNCRKLREE